MKQVISLRLLLTPEQQQRLLELLHTFNAACAYVAAQARAAPASDAFALQALTLDALLERFRLPMPLALRVVLVVAVARARQPLRALTYRAEAAIPLDEQVVAFEGFSHLSLLTLEGRLTVPYFVQRTRRARGAARAGETSLHYRRGHFWLAVTLETELPAGSTLASGPGFAV
jgi:putative transposase